MPSNVPPVYHPRNSQIGDSKMNSDAIVGALKSKTMWLNGIVTIGAGLSWALDHWSILTVFAPALMPYAAVLGAVNMFLRSITTQSLAEKAQ